MGFSSIASRYMAAFCLCSLLVFSCATTSGKIGPQRLPYAETRYAILTADDFGASENINRAIRQAASQGVITAISALTNFTDSLDDLQEISRLYPSVGIGVHLNITTGKPVLDPGLVPSMVTDSGDFYTVDRVLALRDRISPAELKSELRAQIETLKRRGIRVDHLSNQHGLLSLYSPFFEVVLELAQEYDLPVRSCIAASVVLPDVFPRAGTRKKGLSIATSLALRHPVRALTMVKYSRPKEMWNNEKRMEALGIRHPDLTLDYLYGNPTAANALYSTVA